MNLFFNPSVREFYKLICKSSKKAVHDVVVDYDGEVLIDPQLERPELDLNKFKVHLQVSERTKKAIDEKPSRLRKLFRSLLKAWSMNDFTATPVAFSY